jgi:hypothetical protein
MGRIARRGSMRFGRVEFVLKLWASFITRPKYLTVVTTVLKGGFGGLLQRQDLRLHTGL